MTKLFLTHYDKDTGLLLVNYIVYLIQPRFKMKSQKLLQNVKAFAELFKSVVVVTLHMSH